MYPAGASHPSNSLSSNPNNHAQAQAQGMLPTPSAGTSTTSTLEEQLLAAFSKPNAGDERKKSTTQELVEQQKQRKQEKRDQALAAKRAAVQATDDENDVDAKAHEQKGNENQTPPGPTLKRKAESQAVDDDDDDLEKALWAELAKQDMQGADFVDADDEKTQQANEEQATAEQRLQDKITNDMRRASRDLGRDNGNLRLAAVLSGARANAASEASAPAKSQHASSSTARAKASTSTEKAGTSKKPNARAPGSAAKKATEPYPLDQLSSTSSAPRITQLPRATVAAKQSTASTRPSIPQAPMPSQPPRATRRASSESSRDDASSDENSSSSDDDSAENDPGYDFSSPPLPPVDEDDRMEYDSIFDMVKEGDPVNGAIKTFYQGREMVERMFQRCRFHDDNLRMVMIESPGGALEYVVSGFGDVKGVLLENSEDSNAAAVSADEQGEDVAPAASSHHQLVTPETSSAVTSPASTSDSIALESAAQEPTASKPAAPKKAANPRKAGASRKPATAKTPSAPRKSAKPRKAAAPKKPNTPKEPAAPKPSVRKSTVANKRRKTTPDDLETREAKRSRLDPGDPNYIFKMCATLTSEEATAVKKLFKGKGGLPDAHEVDTAVDFVLHGGNGEDYETMLANARPSKASVDDKDKALREEKEKQFKAWSRNEGVSFANKRKRAASADDGQDEDDDMPIAKRRPSAMLPLSTKGGNDTSSPAIIPMKDTATDEDGEAEAVLRTAATSSRAGASRPSYADPTTGDDSTAASTPKATPKPRPRPGQAAVPPSKGAAAPRKRAPKVVAKADTPPPSNDGDTTRADSSITTTDSKKRGREEEEDEVIFAPPPKKRGGKKDE